MNNQIKIYHMHMCNIRFTFDFEMKINIDISNYFLNQNKCSTTREKFDVTYIFHFVIHFPLFLIVGDICTMILHVIE